MQHAHNGTTKQEKEGENRTPHTCQKFDHEAAHGPDIHGTPVLVPYSTARPAALSAAGKQYTSGSWFGVYWKQNHFTTPWWHTEVVL